MNDRVTQLTDDRCISQDEPLETCFDSANPAQIFPLLSEQGNQRLLKEWIANRDDCVIDESSTLTAASFDICIMDAKSLIDNQTELRSRKEDEAPVHLPYLLLLPEAEWSIVGDERGNLADNVLQGSIDEIVSLPLKKAELGWRIDALLRLRSQSLEMRHRNAIIAEESEIRRLFSEVNHTLVRGSDIEDVMSRVVEILGSSSIFECTFSYLTNVQNTKIACGYESDLTTKKANDFHTTEYLETVFENGIVEIEDVTEPPFAQHREELISHSAVALALSYKGERYGVLTVHLPPGKSLSAEKRDLLETLSKDISFFTYNQLLQSEHKSFTEIVQRIEDPIMLQDREGAYRLINDAVADLAGQSKDSLIGKHESAFMNEETAQRIENNKRRVIETENQLSYQITPTFPDGTERTFSTNRYPYYDEAGNLAGTLAICRDVTELEEHKQQLEVLDRVLRHNMSNNMTVVKGYGKLIESDTEGEIADFASKIVANTNEILHISQNQRKITDFLAEDHQIDHLDIVSIIEYMASQVENAHLQAEINLHGSDEATVKAIPAIDDGIKELLFNSIVHSSQEQPITSVHIEPKADTVVIRIKDTNEQIAKMDRELIQGELALDNVHHGSGLGLWLVKLIVDHSKGDLYFEPNDPRGNIVTIELRRAEV